VHRYRGGASTYQAPVENTIPHWSTIRRSIEIAVSDLILGKLDSVLRIQKGELNLLAERPSVGAGTKTEVYCELT
jgi:hypothetical protein